MRLLKVPKSGSLSSRSLLATIVLTASLVSPAPAGAGVYKLYSCNVPGHPTPIPSAAPWKVQLDGLNTIYFDDCASGGSFGVGLNVRLMRQHAFARLVLERPPSGPKSAIGIVRYRTWITAELAGSGAPAFIDDGGAFAPPGGTTPDESPWTSALFAQSNPAVYVKLQCSAGAPADCSLSSARPLQARGVEVDLYEAVPPAGAIEGGTLLQGGAPGPTRTLSFTASDAESGVARVEALLGDTVVATQDLEKDSALCAHTDLNACPTRYSGDFGNQPVRDSAG